MTDHHHSTPSKMDKYHLPPIQGSSHRSPESKLISNSSREELFDDSPFHHNNHNNHNHSEAKYHGQLTPIEKLSRKEEDLKFPLDPFDLDHYEHPLHHHLPAMEKSARKSKLSVLQHVQAVRSHDPEDFKDQEIDEKCHVGVIKIEKKRENHHHKREGKRCFIIHLPFEVFKLIQNYCNNLDYMLFISTTNQFRDYRRKTIRFTVSTNDFRRQYLLDHHFQEQFHQRILSPKNQINILIDGRSMPTEEEFRQFSLIGEVHSLFMRQATFPCTPLPNLLPQITKTVEAVTFGSIPTLSILNKQIEKFHLQINVLDDITPLYSFRHLQEVEIFGNGSLIDVSPLAYVRKVNLFNCHSVMDVSPLTNVYHLILSLLEITDLTGLKNNTIVEIHICTNIQDYSPLSFVKKEVIISFTKEIRNLSYLSNKLTSLSLTSMTFQPIFLSYIPLKSLKSISFYDVNNLTDLSFFANIPSLRIQNCVSVDLQTLHHGTVKDFTYGLPSNLMITTDISPLKDIPKVRLERINFSSSASSLFENVLHLDLWNCNISSFHGLKRLQSIKIRKCLQVEDFHGLYKVPLVEVFGDNDNVKSLKGLGQNEKIILHEGVMMKVGSLDLYPWIEEHYIVENSIPHRTILLLR